MNNSPTEPAQFSLSGLQSSPPYDRARARIAVLLFFCMLSATRSLAAEITTRSDFPTDFLNAGDTQVAEIEIGHSRYPVLPSSRMLDGPGPWFYPQPFTLAAERNLTFYDKTSHVLQLTLIREVTTESLLKASNAIRAAYPTSIVANWQPDYTKPLAMELRGYRITLQFPDGLPPLQVDENLPSGWATSLTLETQLTRTITVKDAQQHKRLSENPQGVQVLVEAMYNFRGSYLKAVSASLIDGIVSDTIESVNPGKAPQQGDLIFRDAQDNLRGVMQRSLVLNLSNISPDLQPYVQQALNLVLQRIGQVAPFNLTDLNGLTESQFVWTPTIGRLEIKPSEFQQFTTNLEKASDFSSKYNQFWDNEAVRASHSGSAEAWHNETRAQLQTGASGSFLFGLVDISNAHLDTAFSNLTSGQRQQVQDVFDRVKNNGYKNEEVAKRAWEKWTGKQWTSSATSHSIMVRRIGSLSVGSALHIVIGGETFSAIKTLRRINPLSLPAEIAPTRDVEITGDLVVRGKVRIQGDANIEKSLTVSSFTEAPAFYVRKGANRVGALGSDGLILHGIGIEVHGGGIGIRSADGNARIGMFENSDGSFEILVYGTQMNKRYIVNKEGIIIANEAFGPVGH